MIMRKLALGLAAATAALGLAAPASATFYPQPAYGYGYGQPSYGYAQPSYGYGYGQRGYGYNSGGSVQHLDMRIGGIRSQIGAMASRGQLRHNRARTLDRQAMNLQRSIRSSAWNGVSIYERQSLEQRVARLEQQVYRAASRGYRGPRYARNRW
jgi:hypothetical protein